MLVILKKKLCIKNFETSYKHNEMKPTFIFNYSANNQML